MPDELPCEETIRLMGIGELMPDEPKVEEVIIPPSTHGEGNAAPEDNGADNNTMLNINHHNVDEAVDVWFDETNGSQREHLPSVIDE